MMRAITLNESPSAIRAREVIVVLLASLLMAISARIVFYLPFSPVPIALHNTVALFLGISLGPRRAALALTLYLLEGVAGLPVFAAGGCGPLYLLGPSGGYLLGFVPAAVLAGGLARTWHHPLRQFLALSAAGVVVYLCGTFHLSNFVGWKNVLPLGVLPFLSGDLFKAFAISYLGASFGALMKRLAP